MVLNSTPTTNNPNVEVEERYTREMIAQATSPTDSSGRATSSKNMPSPPGYVFLKPRRNNALPPNGYTLIVYLHGAGEDADSAAKVWYDLVTSRPDVVIAVPQFTATNNAVVDSNLPEIIKAIITDTVAGDHVDPRHIILAGYSMGEGIGMETLIKYPELFAGFADISGGEFVALPTLRKSAPRLALYINEGSGEGVSAATLAFQAASLRNYGFDHVLAELSPRGHNLVINAFDPYAKRMMTFFDQAMAENDQAKPPRTSIPIATPVVKPPEEVVVEQRKVVVPEEPLKTGPRAMRGAVTQPQSANYTFLAPNSSKFPFLPDPTLFICLPGFGDDAAEFAQRWYGLVQSRQDLVVAVVPGGTPPKIVAIIADTVARDHVNPKHIILVGYDAGGATGGMILGQRPELFAGFAGVATSLPKEAFTPALQKARSRIAVYYAVGAQDEMVNDVYPPNVSQFKNFGFTKLLTEKPTGGHTFTAEEMTNMMTFFDKALAAQDQVAAAEVRK